MVFPSSDSTPPVRAQSTAIAGSAILVGSMLLNSAAIAQTVVPEASPAVVIEAPAPDAPAPDAPAPLAQEPVDVPAAAPAPMQVESANVTIEPAYEAPTAITPSIESSGQGLVQAPDITPMADPNPADHPDAFLPARPQAAVSVGAVQLSAEGVRVNPGSGRGDLGQVPVANNDVIAPPTAALAANAGISQPAYITATTAHNNYATSAPPSTVIAPSYFDPQLLKAMGNLTNSLRMLFPVAIPAPITSLFGWRIHPISGTQRLHTGTDIGAPIGAPVLAAMPGRVILADDMGGYGLAVAIEHDNGVRQTLYAHLSELFVRPGDVVPQGAVIGRVGSTGASTGPHLHFELRQMLPDRTWVALDAGKHLERSMANLLQSLQIAQQPRTTALAKPKK
jgi:murein DD-endopeptidase MepM/ murein hydrolase activator NlpD